ncbi:MAG: dihydropteroate synthase [Bacteroidales bacterium]|nr:dihydropteroate synthase [Bacteroidales bacterium]
MYKGIKIMGIVNLNDDSFYAGSRVVTLDGFCRRVDRLLEEGADIIDIGAASSRPGSTYCGVEEETARLEPFLKQIQQHYSDVRFSIDTFMTPVARMAFDMIGDIIVNDISSGEEDGQMLDFVGKHNLEYIAMHKRGTSVTMDSLSDYDDVVLQVKDYFIAFAEKAKQKGVENWILDPGFGFAKNNEQSREMLYRLAEFKTLGHPLLVGISRKRMVWEPIGATLDNCLEEQGRLHRIAATAGADILRVHDVKSTIEALSAL